MRAVMESDPKDPAVQHEIASLQLGVTVTGLSLIEILLRNRLDGGVAAAQDLSAILQNIVPDSEDYDWDDTLAQLETYFAKYPATRHYYEAHFSGDFDELVRDHLATIPQHRGDA